MNLRTVMHRAAATATGAAIVAALYLVSRDSYLLAHSLIELFTILVAAGVFVIAWNSRRNLDNGYLLLVGIGCGAVGFLDLLHTLAYRGMGVFADRTGDLATQLWLAGRYVQAAAFLAAPFALDRRPRAVPILIAFAAVSVALLLAIKEGVFPPAYVAGVGLTTFKKVSEYVVAAALLAATGLLVARRAQFDALVWRLLAVSLVLTTLSELAFTDYVSVYGTMNLVGHFLRLGAFWALYKAVIETALVKPNAILVRKLALSEEQLRQYAGMLETSNDDLRRSEIRLREDAEKLRARNQELDAFARTVAHDLKDPLSTLMSASALLRDARDLPADRKEALVGVVDRTARRMVEIVEALLLLARVRKRDAPAEPVDMGAVVDAVRARLADAIDDAGATLVVPERWPVAVGYAPWLEEVWVNYITNALKYGGRPPRIELGSSPAGSRIRFWVRDNGPGVPADARSRLFVPFSDLARAGPGSHGLGLSIVLQIVHKLGGDVGVEGEGEGSVFYFTLDAARETAAIPSLRA